MAVPMSVGSSRATANSGADNLRGPTPRIVLTVNTAWNAAAFRQGLIRALIERGYEVVVVAPHDSHVRRLETLGCRFIDLPMDNQGTHPLHDLKLLWRYWNVLREQRPMALLGFTIKPNVYGSIAARALGLPVINNISGLGTTFLDSGWLNRVARMLYRLALSRSRRVFFQNAHDLELFVQSRIVRADQAVRVPGSGVDVKHFSPRPTPSREQRPFRFLLIGRMLWDKGVGEYVDAARLLRASGLAIEARLLGFLEVKNRSAISRQKMQAWMDEGVVRYLGESDDVRDQVAEVDCVVLPSYSEGTPRSLLEAASMGKPIIATDIPGCRDIVIDTVSGYLVETRDVESLASAMRRMIDLPQAVRDKMGLQSREIAVERFDESIVIGAYVDAIAQIDRHGRYENI